MQREFHVVRQSCRCIARSYSSHCVLQQYLYIGGSWNFLQQGQGEWVTGKCRNGQVRTEIERLRFAEEDIYGRDL